MTGGTVIILGEVGDNFAAGMTGGMAFIYDKNLEFERKINKETVIYQRIETEYWSSFFRDLIQKHVTETKSKLAEKIIKDFENEKNYFYQVCPKEMLDKLENPLNSKNRINIAV